MKFGFTALALLVGSLSVASLPVNAETTLNDGVYSKEQAARGKESFEANCKACHLPEFYKDKLASWDQAPLVDFYDLVASTMPQSAPGSLTDEQYADALAYIFSFLGYPDGDKELSYTDGSMDDILIVTK